MREEENIVALVYIIKCGYEEYADYLEYQELSMLDILFNDSIIAEIDRIGIIYVSFGEMICSQRY